MSTTKHTPREWHALKYPDAKTWTVAAKTSVASKITSEEDARLIAASPELLEACKAVSDAWSKELLHAAVDKARSALHKATKGEAE